MCLGLCSPLLSIDLLSSSLLCSALLASPRPRHLPILSLSATNASFHSAALLYTPPAARLYTPSAALLNTGTTLLSPPPFFPPSLYAPALHAAPSHLLPVLHTAPSQLLPVLHAFHISFFNWVLRSAHLPDSFFAGELRRPNALPEKCALRPSQCPRLA